MILYDKMCSSISLCKIAFSNIEMILQNSARIYLTLQVVSGICTYTFTSISLESPFRFSEVCNEYDRPAGSLFEVGSFFSFWG